MCIFCKIINGEIPAYKLYENGFVTCFLDISQATKGHCLVTDINLLNNSGVGAGQTVMHFHLHVLPRYVDDEIDFHQVDHEPNFAELEKLYAKLSQ